MAALVETMFSVREKPWHGLGTIVKEAPTSADAIRLAGLDWTVVQEPIYTNFSKPVEGYRANVRSTDRKVLGVVSDRYKVLQNVEVLLAVSNARFSVLLHTTLTGVMATFTEPEPSWVLLNTR